LSPNFKRRKHWSAYRKPAAAYRAHCAWLIVHWLIQNRLSADKGALKLEAITFYPPDRRRRDDDGIIGSFKAGRDGIADALGVDDHVFRPAYHFAEPVKGGLVVVSIVA
jgi:crossover junction endodeoxyribonuclease RusA